MKRVITLIFLITASFILQCTVFKYLAFGGVCPNLLLALTSCFGFMRGQNEGMLVGFFSGLIVDVFFGGGILGLYALVYTVMGYLNGYFHRVFYPEDVKLPILFIAASDFSYCMIIYVFLFLLRRRMAFFSYLRRVMLPEVVYTVLATLILYRFILRINMRLEADERKQEAKFG